MDKINFQNLPNTTTPINNINLNQLQTNVDNAKVEKASIINQQDLNNIVDTAIYYAQACLHRPDNIGNGYLVVIKYTSNYCVQFYYPSARRCWL